MEYGQVLVWMGMFLALSVLGLPITNLIFDRHPGRGAGFAPTVALGIVSLVAYWVGYVQFGSVALVAGLLALVVSAGLAVHRGADPDWRAFGEAMGVFGSGFLFVVAVRAVDPGILPHLEDFLDYGVMRAVLRASYLPPEDIWFAGVRMRYHYGGHLVAALETMMTGTEPAVAYNLALAGFFAMLLAGTYELAGAIGAATGRSRRVTGALGVYFVGFAGNLLVPLTAVVHALPVPPRATLGSLIADDLGGPAAEFLRAGFDAFQYWDVLQTIPDVLTPYPLFSWLHGELHAHMTSAPFVLLVVGLCYAYYRTPNPEVTRRRRLVFVAVPLAAGFAVLVDTLTAPFTLGVIWLTLIFAPAAPSTLVPARVRARLRTWLRGQWGTIGPDDHPLHVELFTISLATGFAVVLAGLTVAVAAPFMLFTVSGGEESLALVSAADRTGPFALLVVHGAFLAVFVPSLVGRLKPLLAGRRRDVSGAVTAIGAGLTLLTLAVDAPVLLLVAPLVVAGWYVLTTGRARFETVLVVAGAGLVVLVEFVYIANQEYVIDGRGNTVFRAYWHTWLFWSIAAGVILPRLVHVPAVSWRRAPTRETASTLLAVGLVLSTAVYGGVAVSGHFDRAFEPSEESWEQAEYVYKATQMQDAPYPPTQPPTLDGLLYGEVEFPSQTAAIEWLDRRVEGTETILTAPGGRWEWRSAPAALTGIPTVAGWAHELVYRDAELYYARVDDARAIYAGSPAQRVALLERYDVQYVYVGPEERHRYDVWEFTLLDGVSVAYRNPEVVIYRVDQAGLGYSPDPVSPTRYGGTDVEVDETIATPGDRIVVTTGPSTAGTFAWWGPHARLPPGKYVATFRLTVIAEEANPQSASDPAVTVDVARGANENGTADFRVLGAASVNGSSGVRTVSVPFTLTQPAEDVEFRGRVGNRSATVILHGVTVRRDSDNETEIQPG